MQAFQFFRASTAHQLSQRFKGGTLSASAPLVSETLLTGARFSARPGPREMSKGGSSSSRAPGLSQTSHCPPQYSASAAHRDHLKRKDVVSFDSTFTDAPQVLTDQGSTNSDSHVPIAAAQKVVRHQQQKVVHHISHGHLHRLRSQVAPSSCSLQTLKLIAHLKSKSLQPCLQRSEAVTRTDATQLTTETVRNLLRHNQIHNPLHLSPIFLAPYFLLPPSLSTPLYRSRFRSRRF